MGIRSTIRGAAILANRKRLARNAMRDSLIASGALGGGPSTDFTGFTGDPVFESGIDVGGIPIPGGGTIGGTIPGTEGFDITIELGDPSLPGLPEPTPLAAPSTKCFPGFTRDPITGQCRFDLDPGAGQGLPGGNGAAGGGLTRPRATARTVLECPTFADGRKGILWMNALTGDVVCLPRRTSGKGFGLIRKNPPRQKAFISAAEKKLLNKISSVQKRAKTFASSAGFTCKKK